MARVRSTRRSKEAAEKSLEKDEALRTPQENAQSQGLGGRLLQLLDLAEPQRRGKFIRFLDGHIRGRGAPPHGAVHQFHGDLFQLWFHR